VITRLVIHGPDHGARNHDINNQRDESLSLKISLYHTIVVYVTGMNQYNVLVINGDMAISPDTINSK
jgi:hypothetical protein